MLYEVITQVHALVSKASQKIEIHSKPRDDHEYPYAADFIAFISEDQK